VKRLILVGALAVAACAEAPDPTSTAEPLGGDRVVLATFTADVDPVEGTFVLRSTATAAGRALQVLDGDVTVANKLVGATPVTFFNVAQGAGRACTDGYVGNVWGATVTITNRLTDAILGGVYAEITSATPVTALQSCSSAGAPAGLTATPGLWSYAQIAASGTGEKDWVFKYASALPFSFSGRILGAKITAADTTSGTQNPVNHGDLSLRAIVDLDPYVAVAAATSGIDIVTKSSGVRDRSLSTTGTVSAMAVTTDRIWFGTGTWNSTSSSIGYVNRSNWAVSQASATTSMPSVWAIVPDPGYATNGRVWVLGNNFGNTSYLASYTTSGGLGPVTSIADLGYSMALGEDDKLYVLGGSTVRRYTLGDSTPTSDGSWSTGTCTNNPFAIAAGPSGSAKLYFTGAGGVGPICSITTSGTVATVGAVSTTATYYARNIVVGSTGKIWVTTNSPVSAVWEVDTSGAAQKNVRLFTGTGIWPLAVDSNEAVWLSDASGVWKISL